jgi:hypothetical protein
LAFTEKIFILFSLTLKRKTEMSKFNKNCIVGNAVLYKGLPQYEITPCIGKYYHVTIYAQCERSLQHKVCYDKQPNYGTNSGHSSSEVAKAEKYFSDEELKPFISSGGGISQLEQK